MKRRMIYSTVPWSAVLCSTLLCSTIFDGERNRDGNRDREWGIGKWIWKGLFIMSFHVMFRLRMNEWMD